MRPGLRSTRVAYSPLMRSPTAALQTYVRTPEQLALAAERKAKRQKLQASTETDLNSPGLIPSREWIRLQSTQSDAFRVRVMTWNVSPLFFFPSVVTTQGFFFLTMARYLRSVSFVSLRCAELIRKPQCEWQAAPYFQRAPA
jgi:hypothetical protein